MITKEEFIDLISGHKKWDKRLDDVENVLHFMPLEVDWIEYGSILFDKTLSFIFNEEGIEDILWWLWEKNGRSDMKMWDASGKEIPTETIEDLWEIVKDNRK